MASVASRREWTVAAVGDERPERRSAECDADLGGHEVNDVSSPLRDGRWIRGGDQRQLVRVEAAVEEKVADDGRNVRQTCPLLRGFDKVENSDFGRRYPDPSRRDVVLYARALRRGPTLDELETTAPDAPVP